MAMLSRKLAPVRRQYSQMPKMGGHMFTKFSPKKAWATTSRYPAQEPVSLGASSA